VVLAVAWATAAAADQPVLQLEASPSSLRVGDHLTVLVSARGGDALLWGDLTVALSPGGPWELVEGPVGVPGARPPAWQLVLVPMAVGEQQLPEIVVSARTADGKTVKVSADAASTVMVTSILAPEDEAPQPAPLRDPIGARGFPWEWVLPISGAMLPLLGGLAWWWLGRGRGGAEGRRSALPPLAELEALARDLEGRIGRDPADGICDGLAAGFRRFIERRTGEPAEEMTSFELRLMARRLDWPDAPQRLIQRVMGVADGVRFGRRPSTETELRTAVAQALETAQWVEARLASAEQQSVDREAI
jgi:hypothetical protein